VSNPKNQSNPNGQAGQQGRVNGHAQASTERSNGDRSATKLRDAILARRTDFAAMQDDSAYVDAVAARVDLVAASVRLVSSTDEKIAKGELDRLREMKFGKVGPAANSPDAPTVIWDEPGVNVSRNES